MLFEDENLLAEDLFEFSETIDSLVESEVSLQGFFATVAQCLNRAVQGSVFRQQLQGLPTVVPEAAGWTILGEGEIILQISPPLSGLPARLVEQRLVHALKVILRQGSTGAAADSNDDRVRCLLSGSDTPERRGEHLRHLGLAQWPEVTVAAILGDSGALERAEALAADLAKGQPLVTARVGDLLAVLLREGIGEGVGVPRGLSVGLGEALPPERVHDSWEGAKRALRFSQPSRSQRATYRMIDAVIVDISKAGCMGALVDVVDHQDVWELADVRAIHELAEKGAPDTLSVLEAVAATESIRQAAQLAHLHHNTVAARVESAETVLGFQLRENYGRTRLLIALTLYRLYRSSGTRQLAGSEVATQT